MCVCPRCGRGDAQPVIYSAEVQGGDPAPRPLETEPSTLPLDEDSPNYRCASCGNTWPDLRRVEACRELRWQAGPDARTSLSG